MTASHEPKRPAGILHRLAANVSHLAGAQTSRTSTAGPGPAAGGSAAARNGRYRSVFHSPMPPAECFSAARDEMRMWLRHKKYDVARFDDGDPRVGVGAVLLSSDANSADGSRTCRWQLRETREDGAWLSSLIIQAPAQASENARSWIWLEVEFVGTVKNSEARANVPRLARGLLDRIPARDSLAVLASAPTLVTHDRVDDLIDVLCDPDRRLPVVVASAHPDLEFAEWTRVVWRATHYLPGLASIYLLNPIATDEFNEQIGRPHAVWGGAVRTYLTEVDPAVAEDAFRHRVLSGARILADPGRAAGILSVLPRRLASEAPLPQPLARVHRVLLTQTPASRATGDVAAMREQVQGLIGERDLAIDLAEEQESRANSFFEQRESALAELAERDQRVLSLESLVRSLRQRLVAAGQASEAFLPAEEEASPPGSFEELCDWMAADLTSAEFTGDLDPLLALDASPEASTWVRSSWETLRALQSYASTKDREGFPGDFKMWCDHPPSGGYSIPSGKVVRDESESVRNNARWRREREFPVPSDVDGSERIFMGAHVRIGASANGQISPRLYFHDATSSTGRVYIGYLGRHLTNTRT